MPALELSQGVAGRPVGQKKRGSTGPGDETDPYWERMYELCGVSERPFTDATLAEETKPIRAYFNSGLVATRRKEGNFAAWLSDFRTLMDAEHFPPDGERLRWLKERLPLHPPGE